MTTTDVTPRGAATGRAMLNKVPEVTIWFWIIKILCTTVGESFADFINGKLANGLGLSDPAALGWTAVIFTAVFVAVIGWQFATKRYTPFPYWLTVVVVSVTGTLYTDLLTDNLHVRLWVSSAVFSVLLAIVFGIWWLRERTLSIHSITTVPREAFYWLTVLVTFALGTATGDWTLELTNWTPAHSVLLPLGLIISITALWKFGANPVLSFWLAYILTRPLGANIGDWLAAPKVAVNAGDPTGLGLGTLVTSLIFLSAILATVVYLTISRSDVVETYEATHVPTVTTTPLKERLGLVGFVVVAVATAGIMIWAHNQPHATCDPSGASETMPACPKAAATSASAASDVAHYELLAQQTLAATKSGDSAAAKASAQSLLDAWDADATSLQVLDHGTVDQPNAVWTLFDDQLNTISTDYALDHGKPVAAATQEKDLNALLALFKAHAF
ncbi:hypothetical protein Back2_15650 [Nocardioides baekrokdamisoli]|uniref:Membrane-anchored protein n=1 Tax=Nocardioides baekrokdamisoli TaxID=1804624 RepID=A0A3G9J0X1_9ACTN|nr:hypothetical protein [Nocardioides baekrokdamisoli]BBH17278.1 hypothetical protein Back2_15650 [Nocardioides baekrokdamisoli]